MVAIQDDISIIGEAEVTDTAMAFLTGDEGLKKAFEGVDADSSGQISAKEMSDYIAKVYGGYAVPTPDSSASHNCSPLPALASQII